MYKNYKNIKKNRKKYRTIKTKSLILIFIVIIICISIGYAYWNTSLQITGTVTAKSRDTKLPVTVKEKGVVDGINRYTDKLDLALIWIDRYTVQAETLEGNVLTTEIKHSFKQLTSLFYIKPEFKFTLQNNTNENFTNGKIELTEKKDDNEIFINTSESISSQELPSGGSVDINVTGTIRTNKELAENTYYIYKITFENNGEEYYFYYKLIMIPKD